MHIIEFSAENFAKLKVVDIRPAGALVQIAGKNAQGKTSVLDGIWATLGGGKAIPVEPIRHGEEQARLRIVLGDERPELIVTRKFSVSDNDAGFTTAIKVENGEGSRFERPQEVLNALLGSLTFDPLAFTRLKDEDRLAMLRPLDTSGIDFEAMTTANKDDFTKRTDVNRRAKEKRAQADGVIVPPGAVPQEADLTALETEFTESAQFNADVQARRARRAAAVQAIENTRTEEAEIRSKLDALIAYRETLETKLAESDAIPDEKDILGLRDRLAIARENNAHAAKAKERADLNAQAAAAEAEAKALTKAIDDRDAAMAAAVAGAVGTVPGLGYVAGKDGELGHLTLNGAPFDMASGAEQLEASIDIASLLGPTLKVVRVKDGSLMDEDTLARVAAKAAAKGMQVWVETVRSDGAVGFVLEDGELRGAAPKPAEAPAAAAEADEAI